MELDEALLKIVELEEQIETQNTTLETLTTEKEKKEKEIERLQKSNMDLFLKVTNKGGQHSPVDEPIEDNDEDQPSKFNKLIEDWSV